MSNIETPEKRGSTANRVVSALPYVVLIGVGVLAYWQTFRWLLYRWGLRTSYYSHGYLVPFIAAFLLWQKREELRGSRWRLTPLGAMYLGLAAAMLLVASILKINFISAFSLIPAALGVAHCLGKRTARACTFPILFLIFMLPLPMVAISLLSFRLKMLAADAVAAIFTVAGMPVVQQGSYLHFEWGSSVVGDICSGLRTLISLLALGVIFAYIAKLNRLGKTVMLLLALPFALVANITRITLTCLIQWRFGPEISSAPVIHLGTGLLIFVVAFVLLAVSDRILRRFTIFAPSPDAPTAPSDTPSSSDTECVTSGGGGPVAATGCVSWLSGRPSLWATACVMVLPALLAFRSIGASGFHTSTHTTKRIPRVIGEWTGVDEAVAPSVKEILETEDVLERTYFGPQGERVHLAVVRAQRNRRALHPPEVCIEGSGIEVLDRHLAPFALKDVPGPTQVVRLVLSGADGKQALMFYWYLAGERQTPSYHSQQFRVAMSRLLGRKASGALVKFSTPLQAGNIEKAEKCLWDFIKVCLPSIIAENG